jgi:hypothetical protein
MQAKIKTTPNKIKGALIMGKKEASKYQPLPDKTVVFTAAQYQQLCFILEEINSELIFRVLEKTKNPKECHVDCTFYFDQIRDNEIKIFKELLYKIYSASCSCSNNLSLLEQGGANENN